MEQILTFIPTNGHPKILDVGCWSGRFYEFLTMRIPQSNYIGIDISKNLIWEAQHRFPEGAFIYGDMRDLEKTMKETFDCIVFLASFHHLWTKEERKSVLRTVKRLLHSEGMVLLTNWNLRSSENRKQYTPISPGGSEYEIKIGAFKRYYHAFSMEELASLAREEGYEIVLNEYSKNERNIVSVFRPKR